MLSYLWHVLLAANVLSLLQCLQVQQTGEDVTHGARNGGGNSQCDSMEGSQDSQKENSGSATSTGTKAAPGTTGAPLLDFTHSPLIGGVGNASVPALKLHQVRYDGLFGDDADDEDAVVPDTERGMRWSLRTPPKCDEFHREVPDHAVPLVLPQETPASGVQRRSSARSIHATSPSPLHGCHQPTVSRVPPSPIHVLPQQPHPESSTPNMGSFLSLIHI